VLGDGAPQRGEVLAANGIRRLVAVALEERCRTDEVGEQDRDEGFAHVTGTSSPLPVTHAIIPVGDGLAAIHPAE
jgi:hypothetical protein